MKELAGILKGTDQIIEAQLGLYKHGFVGMKLHSAPQKFSPQRLLKDMIVEIENNLKKARCPSSGVVLGTSKENWREYRPKQKHDSRKQERDFEHQLADAGGSDKNWIWWNQMPIASGLVEHRADRTRAIDLVCKLKEEPSHYRFVELKCDRRAGTPLVALMEIIRYGLVYLVLRKNREHEWLGSVDLTMPIFQASQIDLCVLAPKDYYVGYNLSWLEVSLESAINEICEEQLESDLTMGISSHYPTELADSKFDTSKLKLESYLINWSTAYSL